MASEKWSNMSDNEKKKFLSLAEDDKARYDKEMLQYKKDLQEQKN